MSTTVPPTVRCGVSLEFSPPSFVIIGNNEGIRRTADFLLTIPSGHDKCPSWIHVVGGLQCVIGFHDCFKSRLTLNGNIVTFELSSPDIGRYTQQLLGVAKHNSPSHAYLDIEDSQLAVLVTTEDYGDNIYTVFC